MRRPSRLARSDSTTRGDERTSRGLFQMKKKLLSLGFAMTVLVAMVGASAPKRAEALQCNAPWCPATGDGDGGGGGSGGSGGGGAGGYCPPQGIYTCILRPTGAWICGYQPC